MQALLAIIFPAQILDHLLRARPNRIGIKSKLFIEKTKAIKKG